MRFVAVKSQATAGRDGAASSEVATDPRAHGGDEPMRGLLVMRHVVAQGAPHLRRALLRSWEVATTRSSELLLEALVEMSEAMRSLEERLAATTVRLGTSSREVTRGRPVMTDLG